ncbi:MAG: FIST N-terminal domain-containing protein [Campylobacterota bacterium]|nr:FIST N-terminal domain-containing protein [Campylobacterota bacterium]
MKTINTIYTDEKSLKEFLNSHAIPNDEKVLLQIFTGVLDEDYINNMIRSIVNILPKINIIGSSTDGEIIDTEVKSNSTVLSFSIFEETSISIYKIEKFPSCYQTGKHLIKKIENKDDAKAAIVFADGLNTNGEIFLKAFHKYAPHIQIAGGLAGDNATFKKTYIFTKEGVDDSSAIAAVLYNPNLIVNTSFSFGWEEIGKEMTITKSVENRVYTIDDISTTNIYKKYLGKEIEEALPATGIEFPLIINRQGNKIARAVVGKNDDGSLVFAGNIRKGDKVHLGYGNIENILDNRFNLYDNISQYPFESIFIYSCMARKRLLGDEIKNEIVPMSKAAPLSGFFTYGEFYFCDSSSSCDNQLLNQTTTVLTLSESKNSKNNIDEDKKEKKQKAQTIKALSHLISETSKELNLLNNNLKEKIDLEVNKNMQQELRILEQSKMASMGEMMANIAHQWRQPLSSISTVASGVKLNYYTGMVSSDEEMIDNMDLILSKTEYLSNTINTFRDFLKEKKEFKKVVLQDRLDMVFHIIGTSLKDNHIDLKYNYNDLEPLNIEMVVGELDQVIINIINNAKDALTEKNIENGVIDIELFVKDDKATITIEDNAGGIPSHVLPRIFEPYFTTKHQSQGTGLGLHMSYKIITESLNGKLYAKNSNKGAKFTIELPLN